MIEFWDTAKLYKHNPESILENDMHEIQTDHLIPARRPGLLIINKKKKTCCLLSENKRK